MAPIEPGQTTDPITPTLLRSLTLNVPGVSDSVVLNLNAEDLTYAHSYEDSSSNTVYIIKSRNLIFEEEQVKGTTVYNSIPESTPKYVTIQDEYITIGVPNEFVNGQHDAGVVYVLNRTSGELVSKLQAPDAVAGARFGSRVDTYGNYAVVLSNGNSAVSSSVYLFDIASGTALDKKTEFDAGSDSNKWIDGSIAINDNFFMYRTSFSIEGSSVVTYEYKVYDVNTYDLLASFNRTSSGSTSVSSILFPIDNKVYYSEYSSNTDTTTVEEWDPVLHITNDIYSGSGNTSLKAITDNYFALKEVTTGTSNIPAEVIHVFDRDDVTNTATINPPRVDLEAGSIFGNVVDIDGDAIAIAITGPEAYVYTFSLTGEDLFEQSTTPKLYRELPYITPEIHRNYKKMESSTNSPDSEDENMFMSAKAVAERGGKMQHIIVTEDTLCHRNKRHVSLDDVTYTLPTLEDDPTIRVGDIIVIDQVAGISTVIAQTPNPNISYKHEIDATKAGRRIEYELFPGTHNTVYWSHKVVGNGSVNGNVAISGYEEYSLGTGGDTSSGNTVTGVGLMLRGTNVGGSSWTFDGLVTRPSSDTFVFVNGQFMDSLDTSWSGLTLTVNDTVATDKVLLLVSGVESTDGGVELTLTADQIEEMGFVRNVDPVTEQQIIDWGFAKTDQIPTEQDIEDMGFIKSGGSGGMTINKEFKLGAAVSGYTNRFTFNGIVVAPTVNNYIISHNGVIVPPAKYSWTDAVLTLNVSVASNAEVYMVVDTVVTD